MPLWTPPAGRVNSYAGAPQDHGFVSWTMDLGVNAIGSGALPTAGVIHGSRLFLPRSALISNITIHIITAGATLTANQCGAAIYESGTTPALSPLKGQTANTQNTSWQSPGTKVIPLVTAFVATPGYYDVVFWANGTTGPAASRNTGSAAANANLTGTAIRFFSANTAITTTPPTTLGAKTATTFGYWFGLS